MGFILFDKFLILLLGLPRIFILSPWEPSWWETCAGSSVIRIPAVVYLPGEHLLRFIPGLIIPGYRSR